jgi:hypothetical protein
MRSNSVIMEPAKKAPAIAFVGLLGSGKTTLAATLANRLVSPDPRGVYLSPIDHRTMVTVQQTWLQLQAREWPASTLQGSYAELRWKLNVSKTRSCEMRMVDVAGQDLYEIFSEDRALSPEKIAESQKAVLEYCRSADIVLLLINLGDFIGEGDRGIAMRNEAAMKSALDFLRTCSRHKRIEGWSAILAKSMPFFFHSHLQDGSIPVLPVAAVFDTEIIMDPESGPRRVPAPNFRSAGLDVLIQWLSDQVFALQGPMDPDPQIMEARTEWIAGLLSTYLTGDLTLKNEGAGGKLRVIATSLCDGQPVETGLQEVLIEPNQVLQLSFRLKGTRFIASKRFTIEYRFEKL